MSTVNSNGVTLLDADGSDEVRNYPNIQRSNAAKLTDAISVTYGIMDIDKSLSESYCVVHKVGKVMTMTVFFKTGSLTGQPEIFPKLLNPKFRPMEKYYAPLTGVTKDGRAVATILRITTDGNMTHLREYPLAENATYTGNFAWVTANW